MPERSTPLVLFVDDEPAIRELYAQALDRAGFRVFLAEDGLAGLVKAHALLPDVIVIDYVMPGPSGLEIVDRLKADARTCAIPVVLFSGDALDKADTTGCAAVVRKPSPTRVVVDAIRAQLRAR